MKNLIKFIYFIFRKSSTVASTETLYCNDPIVIEGLGRRVGHKEAFFNLYVRSTCDSGSHFPVYLAQMIRHCRLHMYSLPTEERQSFFDFCLMHKVDISDESLEIANQNERECYTELNELRAKTKS
ncbi:hypothetical protein ABLV18_27780 [Klebsiella sp. CN_Kp114]|uniref:hypothetical protein n=1 Tax=unclassified Klebsiella TaxID=2608929 RepID=UPI0032B51E78